MPFIPHTEHEIREMLAAIGVDSIERLFDEIPAALRVPDLPGVPEGLTEMEVSRIMHARAAQDGHALNFIGAGAYEHHIPAAVWEITTRGEFYSAYTPYQAEASQGTLQLLYEYQSMMASLTGMDVSNASLYDGATALAEACLMAVRAHRKSTSRRILMPLTVHPLYRQVAEAICATQDIRFEYLPYCTEGGNILPESLEKFAGQDITAIVIPQPNFFGILEEADALADWARQNGALVIGLVNPTSLALLKPPGRWGEQGADIVCGEGQPLGVPLANGGPYFGFMCCRMEHVRQMPGRIVGRTVDLDGKWGYTLTLQAREQHIRRAKATSNICTNQGLLVTAATIYMSLLGPEGLARVAAASHAATRHLRDALIALPGVEIVFNRPYFHELVVRLDRPVAPVLETLADRGIAGGFDLAVHYPELGHALLVCATETKTDADIRAYAGALREVLTQTGDKRQATGRR
ncbi:MAG TPA: aminomethyl-transferring glycine dehydrogenase subunit GcvPA [Gammaproteobacteria bacterium]|nr:aminomethyl-transferring glycine dehydrogenase subunit GcvPA [Gammaproteobacteria bacterium]